ncbi:MAG: hypothetical protein AAF151_24295 [Cyanobacteria bacterium J06656_5]
MTRDELLQVIEEAAQTGAKELDLSGNELTELPRESSDFCVSPLAIEGKALWK